MMRTLTVVIDVEHPDPDVASMDVFGDTVEDHLKDKLLGTSFSMNHGLDQWQVTHVSVETVEDPTE